MIISGAKKPKNLYIIYFLFFIFYFWRIKICDVITSCTFLYSSQRNFLWITNILIKLFIRAYVPGDPQKSVSKFEELKRVLNPKSHSFKSTHFPRSLSNVRRIFSGFKSMNRYCRGDD